MDIYETYNFYILFSGNIEKLCKKFIHHHSQLSTVRKKWDTEQAQKMNFFSLHKTPTKDINENIEPGWEIEQVWKAMELDFLRLGGFFFFDDLRKMPVELIFV